MRCHLEIAIRHRGHKDEVVAGFVQGALCVKQAGGDGVELHGAQGHLIQQFVSPYSNQRDDAFGGSLEKRLRFPLEIITRMREVVGRDFILGYRMGVEEFTQCGLGIADARRMAQILADLNVLDFLSLTQGNFNTHEGRPRFDMGRHAARQRWSGGAVTRNGLRQGSGRG